MRRREFITFLGSTAVWPLAARAQQSDRMRRIGVLTSVAADDPNGRVRIAAFLQGLQQLGWTVGRNVQIEYCWAAGSPDDIYKYAAELVALTPEVIFAARGTSLGALLQATRAVPIVFAIVPDPVGSGFVDSLPRPGGNTTGFMQFEYSLSGKWLELLKQIAPIRQARIHRQVILSCASPDQPPYWLLFRFLLAPLKRGPVVNALAKSVI